MSRLLILPILLTAAAAQAQFPGGQTRPFPGGTTMPAHTITTASDYAVVTDLGGTGGFDSEATGTAVTRALSVRAASGATFRGDSARASSTIAFSTSAGKGAGATIHETGADRNTDPARGASAGTSADAPGTASPTQGAHSVRIAYPNIAAGNGAIVTIEWLGFASTGASASADVDVNGDGIADFSGTATGGRASASLQVTAGASGVAIDVTTRGSASVAADGAEHYGAALSVWVREGTLPTSCTFTNFDVACGADLNGTVATPLALSLDVTNAPANAFGFVVIGNRAATPIPLPVGTCNLLIDARRHFGLPFRTDAMGAASVGLRTPRSALTVSFQALVMSLDPATMTRSLGASNGTELVCQ